MGRTLPTHLLQFPERYRKVEAMPEGEAKERMRALLKKEIDSNIRYCEEQRASSQASIEALWPICVAAVVAVAYAIWFHLSN